VGFRYGLLLLSLGLVSSLAFARVGEPRGLCDARYGQPVKVSDDGTLVMYKSNGRSVVVHFLGGCADMVSHSKLPSVAGESPLPFSDAQVVAILKANGGERSWVAEATETGTAWHTTDGALRAIHFRSLNRVMVYTRALADSGLSASMAESGG
jgi:hypothetical protein